MTETSADNAPSRPAGSTGISSSDQQLIASYLRGEVASTALIDDWIDGASIPFRRRLQTDWDDIAQGIRVEVFGLLKRGAFEGRSSLKTYVWRVTAHSCLDAVRRLDRSREVDPEPVFDRLLDRQPAPDRRLADQQLKAERTRLLERVLARLKPECLELWRAIIAGDSYKQMSERYGVSPGTLRVRVLRCRERARAVREEIESADADEK